MLITSVCPGCRESFQLQPSLRGQAIHCPRCRKVFIVGKEHRADGAPTNSRPPSGNGQSGDVSELLEVLPAEIDAPPLQPIDEHVGGSVPLLPADPAPIDESYAPPATSWADAPPPVRVPGVPRGEPPAPQLRATKTSPQPPATAAPSSPAPTRREPDTRIKLPQGDTRLSPSDDWEPPPVRRGPVASTSAPFDTPSPSEPSPAATEEELPRKKRSAAWVAFLLALTLCIGGGGWFGYDWWNRQQEQHLRDAARQKLAAGEFANAEADFEALRKWRGSEHAGEYDFLYDLSAARKRLMQIDDVSVALPLEAVESLVRRAHEEDREALLREFAKVLREGLVNYSKLVAQQFAKPTDDKPAQVLTRIDEAAAALDKSLGGKDGFTAQEREALAAHRSVVQAGLNELAQRQAVRDDLAKLKEAKVSADTLRVAEALLTRSEKALPGIRGDAAVAAALGDLYREHRQNVGWKEGSEVIQRVPPEDEYPSILVDPFVNGSLGRAGNGRVVLALVRGVLYALDRSNGRVQWAMRVGIDTTTLPLRVPATESSPERILVVSTDTQTVTALDADGNQVWRYRLDSRSLGRPVVEGRRAYLTTYGGDVHVIELVEGRLLGRYTIGQNISLGATLDEASKRLYVAADHSCVYVFDTEGKTCEAILYTDHLSGSQRSEPIVAPADGQGGSGGFLVLNQSDGSDNVLKVYELPLEARRTPVSLPREPRVPGWSWFRPHQDGEKIIILSDAGVLGAFGIKQANNADPLLFPLLPGPSAVAGGLPGVGLPLDGLLQAKSGARGRAEVVHLQGNDLWVLAHGKLQRLRVGWHGQSGPRLAPAWPAPLELGSPQHVSQVEEDRLGNATLYLVTQSLTRPVYLASAVNDEDGKLLWQRQLGMVAQGEPRILELDKGKKIVLAMDESGGLFAFDVAAPSALANALWQSRGKLLTDKSQLDENPNFPPLLLPGANKASALQIASPGQGRELVLRFIGPAAAGDNLQVTELKTPLPAPLAGPPVQLGNRLILPLANGVLGRLDLPGGKAVIEGPNWRARIVGSEAAGYVAPLEGDRFISTDGVRGLTVWDWSAPAQWIAFPPERDPPTLELPDRISGAPLVLPAGAGGLRAVAVPTADGAVTLLTVQRNGLLQVARTWKLPGKITAGPFLLGDAATPRIGCVVGGHQLVAIDPGDAALTWTYRSTGKSIVGVPQLVAGKLIVADHSGRFVALDPKTGKSAGPGHQLRGSLGPASAPVAFAEGQLFAPLSDGTILLLPLDRVAGGVQPARAAPATGASGR